MQVVGIYALAFKTGGFIASHCNWVNGTFLKDATEIDSTLAGNVRLCKLVQSINVPSLMEVILSDKSTFCKLVQPLKTYLPNEVTEFGIVIVVS